MNKFKRITFFVASFLLLTTLNSCKVGRFIVYNFASIKDHKIFPTRDIEVDSTHFSFPLAEKPRVPKEVNIGDKSTPFEKYLEDNKTVAFLIIQNDTIHYENYWHKYDEASIVPSFSVAKSITSILIGCAIEDGYIQNVDEPVSNYVPELKEKGFNKVTIEHLLQMTSGLKFNENYYNPFGDAWICKRKLHYKLSSMFVINFSVIKFFNGHVV